MATDIRPLSRDGAMREECWHKHRSRHVESMLRKFGVKTRFQTFVVVVVVIHVFFRFFLCDSGVHNVPARPLYVECRCSGDIHIFTQMLSGSNLGVPVHLS
jgi:hypothetical protein